MNQDRTPRLALFAGICLLLLAAPGQAQNAPTRAITQVSGDLYRFQNNFHYSVFLVTDEGVIATDPIDADAARWLEAQIRERFGKEIRYLIYSHDHRDHSAGGEVWADTATVVAHANRTIIGENLPTAVSEITFTDRMTIELGGKTVELHYPGRSHSDNLIVMLFPAERALFAVDFISTRRLPYRDFSDAYLPDWVDAIDYVTDLDFDTLLPGHGAIGTRQDAVAAGRAVVAAVAFDAEQIPFGPVAVDHGEYIRKLYQRTLAAARAGKSLEQAQQEITMSEYSDWGQYEAWRALNVKGMYEHVQMHRRGN